VVLSSDDDDTAARPPEHDVPVERRKVSADTEGAGRTSVEALIPGLVGVGAPSNPRPPIAKRAPTVPPSGACGRKRLRFAVKRSTVKRSDPLPRTN
jgi:hypothetical protein